MIRETELNLFVPSPELLVRLASGDRPLGVRAGPPRIKSLRETYFDTPDQALRRRGMTCKLRQVEGEQPSVVVTVGEGPDSEGITSRSRLSASAIGAGVYETLAGDSEPASQVQKFVDPNQLRPQIALDIQRLGRVYRGGLLLKPVLLLFFDRVTVQVGASSSIFHEISIRRRREGGPLIRDLAQEIKDRHHLFPDGLTTLQRAYRVLAVEKKATDQELSPYGLSLALAVFKDRKLGLIEKDGEFHIPTFRGSGEDAARALSSDLTGDTAPPLLRLGTTEPREGRAVAELWTIADAEIPCDAPSAPSCLTWFPWEGLLEEMGRWDLKDPTLVAAVLLLTRRKLLGQTPWIEAPPELRLAADLGTPSPLSSTRGSPLAPELSRVESLFPLIREAENRENDLEIRLRAASQISEGLSRTFLQDVTRAKGRILSGRRSDEGKAAVRLLDLLSIRIRGIVDRLYRCFHQELSEALEETGIHLRTWSGLMYADKVALLEDFSSRHLPSMQVAPEWGPSFIPEMPMAGCAVGILARFPNVDGTRFFHVVLRRDPPAFLPVPGSKTVLPMDEVIRGYFISQVPELEQAETYSFRFTTGAATVREPVPVVEAGKAEPQVDPISGETEKDAEVDLSHPPEPAESPALPSFQETRQSVVVRILVPQRMPEGHQAQLLRALERQVSRRNPLIGWSDIYPVRGPLDLSGLGALLELEEG